VLCLIKVSFFFNPFVLAISESINVEREKICDDLADEACGDPLIFANSLSQFANVTSVSQSAMAANKDKYLLLERVKRLFPAQSKLSATTERLIALACAGLLGLHLNVNAKNQPAPAAFESTPIQKESINVMTEHETDSDTNAKGPSSNTVFTKPNMSTDNAGNQTEGMDETSVASSTTDNLAMTVQPTRRNVQNNEPLPEELVKRQTTVLLAKNNSINAHNAARNYIESAHENVKTAKTEVKQSQETTQTPQQLARSVYASTDKSSSFSLESPHALANIDQMIFAPISTNDTEFSVGARKWRNVVSQYFSEMQNQLPRVVTFNSKEQATADFTGMNTSLIAQIRIKDIKLVGAARKGIRTNIYSRWRNSKSGNSRTMATKWRDSRRVDNVQKTQRSPNLSNTPGLSDININSPIQSLETTKALHSRADLAKAKFVLEVIAEVVFVDATSYEYIGVGIKKIWLKSSNLEPSLLTLARDEEGSSNSRTKAYVNADIIKNAWDILISHIQNDVYQVATTIKNQELELYSSAPEVESQTANRSVTIAKMTH
jgi:hypothetical protein